MEKFLKFLGWIFIITGIAGAIIIVSQVDWSQYDISKQVATELWDNNLAQQKFDLVKSAVFAQIQVALTCLFSGIAFGMFFQALSKIIELLRVISNKLSEE